MMVLKGLVHFSLRILVCERSTMEFLLLRKGLIARGLVPRWLCQRAGREKRDFNVRFNEVPKVTAAGGEAPGRSEKR